MRKALMIVLFAIVLRVGGLSGGDAFSQPSEEVQQQIIQLNLTLMQGTMLGPEIFWGIDKEQLRITDEQIVSLRMKMNEAIRPFEEELRNKFGNPGDLTQERISDIAETMSMIVPKANEIYRNTMNETFSAETIKQIDTVAFQRFGGVFGGALNVENLSALDLSDEQKEKAAKIIDQLNRERFGFAFSTTTNRMAKGEADLEELLEEMKEKSEAIVSITRRGQREIEALLTPEQKKLADELMAEVPEKYRFLSEYLTSVQRTKIKNVLRY